MKKILISIGVLMTMSFTLNKVTNYELESAKDDLYDYIEWMQQDIESGKIDPEIGELYIENFESTLKKLNSVERDFIHLTQK
tara:strand:+ start:566 stop:811 length:246 start_codon:yes stop_codon:yes gene_type:complete